MHLLALETGFGKFSLSLFSDGKAIDRFTGENENEQAELLIPAIEKILQKNNIKYQDVSYIAVNLGPGSFTGVRIGLAAAKGLALASGAKLIGVSSLAAAAYQQGGGKVYLNAQRGEAYFQEFDSDLRPLGQAALISYAEKYSPLPDSESIGHMAWRNLDAPPAREPLYVRKPDVKFKLRAGKANDAKWLAAIHAECFSKPWDEAAMAAALDTMACLIAENLGFVIYEITGNECEIKTIAVLPAATNKGIGSFLCQNVLKTCRSKGVTKIFLEVEENNLAAIKLYQNLGFENFSRRRDYYGKGRHALNMRLAFKP